MSKPIKQSDIERLQRDLETHQENWLRDWGWEHTSQTPHSCWMWQKEIGGKTFMVSKQTALTIQEFLTPEEDDERAQPDREKEPGKP